LLLVLVTLTACRGASPSTGAPLHLSRVYNGPPLASRTSSFTSSSADLAAIQSSIRGSFAFGGNPIGTGFAWDYDGRTEDYSPLLGTHAVVNHAVLPPLTIANYAALQDELTRLSADAALSSLLGVVTLPNLPPIQYVQGLSLGLEFEQTQVRWGVAPSSGALLRLDLPLRVGNIDLDDFADVLFDVGDYTVPMTVGINVDVCGDCTSTGAVCNDAPGTIAQGYRGFGTTLGYSPTDRDAVYADIGVNFTVTTLPAPPAAGRRLPGITGSVAFTGACPFAIGDIPIPVLGDILDVGILSYASLGLLIEIARGAFGPIRYVAGLIACSVLTSSLDGRIRDALGPVPSSLQPAVDLLVNPVALRRSLGSLGTNLPGVSPIVDALRPSVLDRAIVQVGLTGGPVGSPPVPLTSTTGAFTDALFGALASPLGSTANTNTVVDMGPVNDACGVGVGLGSATSVDATVCGACAAGGVCAGATSPCAAFCAPGGGFVSTLTFPGPTSSSTCTTAGICLASAPNLASLLATAPLFGETIRRWFSTPLPAGARYSATGTDVFPGQATFSYIIDPDDDCAPEETDVCPGVFDPAQLDDGDGDIYGFVCDRCRGVNNSAPWANADTDMDGIADGCDCDRDGDGCFNEGTSLAGACPPNSDGIFDRRPSRAGTNDFDGDGLVDDCDNDLDEDGVLDEPTDGSAPDNCPLGDGDSTFEPGDQNPDQTDSGGPPAGDLCDRLCPDPSAPLCDTTIDGGSGFGAGRSDVPFDGIAGLGDCIGLSGGAGVCDISAYLSCPGADYDSCWLPDAFDSVILVGSLGGTLTQIDAAQMGLVGGFSSSSTTLPDIDGDGLDELVLSAPRAEVCPAGKACFGSPGMLAVFGSERGKLITRVMGAEDGSRFGASMARLGDVLAVGAPFAAAGRGATYFYRVDGEELLLLSVVTGNGPSERLGTNVAPAFGADTAAPSFLIGAPGARAGAGRLFIANASQGITHRYDGPRPLAGMSRGVVLGTAAAFTVVAGIPSADAGRGVLAFFEGNRRGAPPRIRRGSPRARLGERVVVVDRVEVVASAPGVGAVIRYAPSGAPLGTTSSSLPLFGTGLSAPGDLNGDGADDLIVSFGLEESGALLRSLPLYRL